MSVHRLLGDLNDLGLRLVDSIETCLQLDFNWLVALISAIACHGLHYGPAISMVLETHVRGRRELDGA